MLKKCSKCGVEFPATEEYFHIREKGKLRAECKICISKIRSKHHEENKNKIAEWHKEYYKNNKNKIAEYKKEHYKNNQSKILEYHKEYRKNNHDKIIICQKEHYKNNRHKKSKYDKERYVYRREQVLKKVKEYRDSNPDVIMKRKKIYYASEKGKLVSVNSLHKRKARERELESSFTNAQWSKCLINFDNKCCYCGKNKKLAQDHFIALSKGGEYSKNNIIPACQHCNSSKNNKDFFEWYPQQEFYSKGNEEKILKYLNYNKKLKTQQLALI